MKVVKVMEGFDPVIAVIEVRLGSDCRSAATLCVRGEGKIIPLNTPDGRPILMNLENAIELEGMT
ncbi:MAG: hypothetical protein VW226_09565 [Rhodospirillaceae bacterium]|jgi:hypothetical protein